MVFLPVRCASVEADVYVEYDRGLFALEESLSIAVNGSLV